MKKHIVNTICKVVSAIFLCVIFSSIESVQASVELGIKEDVNKDGIVDEFDMELISSRYNTISTSSLYNEDYDVNQDNIIDIYVEKMKIKNRLRKEEKREKGSKLW